MYGICHGARWTENIYLAGNVCKAWTPLCYENQAAFDELGLIKAVIPHVFWNTMVVRANLLRCAISSDTGWCELLTFGMECLKLFNI